MQNSPLVSVVMSVFNTEKYLAEAIESILNQTYLHFEFIIIDDGSTDSSLEIIQEYAKKDGRIRVIVNSENLGLPRSLNKGIDMAQGVYIARMDPDDISLSDRFEKQINYLNAHPETFVLGGQLKCFGASDYISSNVVEKEILRWQLLLNIPVIAHPTAMINKQSLISIGKYPENSLHAEDRALWNELYIHSEFPISNLPDILYLYRIHESNVSIINKNVQVLANIKFQLKLLKYEFDLDIDENIINIMNYPKPVNFSDVRKLPDLIFELLNKYISIHNIKDISIITKLKQTTASYIFGKMYRFPLRGCIAIIKSIILYPPVVSQYAQYYLSVPKKLFSYLLRRN